MLIEVSKMAESTEMADECEGKLKVLHDKVKIGDGGIVNLVQTYRECEVLWNYEHCDYKNKNKRRECFEKIQKKFGFANIEQVKRKLKSIRDTFTAEKNKMQKSRKSGAGTDDIYNTKLIWFDLAASFLSKSGGRESYDNLNKTSQRKQFGSTIISQPNIYIDDEYETTVDQHAISQTCEQNIVVESEKNVDLSTSSFCNEHDIYVESSGNTKKKVPKKLPSVISKKRKNEKDEFPGYIHTALSKLEELKNSTAQDEYYYFGQNIACQLRAMPKSHALQIQSNIQELISRNRLELLPGDSWATKCCNTSFSDGSPLSNLSKSSTNSSIFAVSGSSTVIADSEDTCHSGRSDILAQVCYYEEDSS